MNEWSSFIRCQFCEMAIPCDCGEKFPKREGAETLVYDRGGFHAAVAPVSGMFTQKDKARNVAEE